MMMPLPKNYQWLDREKLPSLLAEMRALYGTIEVPGPANNPLILQWAKEIGLGHIYKSDAIAWCGLAMAYASTQSRWNPPHNPLWARNWARWGNPVTEPMLGDVVVFSRGKINGHVGLYIAEDKTCYHVIGGNQGDAVSIKPILKSRLISARRCPWKINQPPNVRRVFMAAGGKISTNEE